MDFYEVITPHIAVPVLCVLIAAMLVFAFGFKSPGQPPSLNYNEDRRIKKNKRLKEKNPAVQRNGQVHLEDTKPSPKALSHNNTVKRVKSPRVETKGLNEAKNVSKTSEVRQDDPPPAEDDTGEWTTFVSRKDKKLREMRLMKEDEEVDVPAVSEPSPRVSKPVKGKKAPSTEAPPLEDTEELQRDAVKTEEVASGDHDASTDMQVKEAPTSIPEPSAPIPAAKATPPPPPRKIFDVEIDIQSVDRKPKADTAAIRHKETKSPKKKKKEKKEQLPSSDSIIVESAPAPPAECNTSTIIPETAIESCDQPSEATPATPMIPDTPQSTVESDDQQHTDTPTEPQGKAKKKKARRDN